MQAMALPSYTQGFKSMFTKDDFDILPEHHYWDHTIELLLGSKPKSTKVYPLSPVEQKELDAFLEENLHTRCIQPSKLPMAALHILHQKERWLSLFSTGLLGS